MDTKIYIPDPLQSLIYFTSTVYSWFHNHDSNKNYYLLSPKLLRSFLNIQHLLWHLQTYFHVAANRILLKHKPDAIFSLKVFTGFLLLNYHFLEWNFKQNWKIRDTSSWKMSNLYFCGWMEFSNYLISLKAITPVKLYILNPSHPIF